jgi:hypothetical protein
MEFKKNIPVRAVIYVKDVMMITGKKLTAARTLYNSIQAAFQKLPGQFVTVEEFCIYTGIKEEKVNSFLN